MMHSTILRGRITNIIYPIMWFSKLRLIWHGLTWIIKWLFKVMKIYYSMPITPFALSIHCKKYQWKHIKNCFLKPIKIKDSTLQYITTLFNIIKIFTVRECLIVIFHSIFIPWSFQYIIMIFIDNFT